jgi:5-methylcytosine-specific restriction protein A
MPFAAPKHCAHGHPPYRGASCPLCTAKRKAEADARRPSAQKRGYDSEWRAARAAFLVKHPRCAECGGTAYVVDHIEPHKGDDRLFRDRTNWQSLCHRCHSRKTAQHDGGFGNRRRGVVSNSRQGSGYRAGHLARNSAENCTS